MSQSTSTPNRNFSKPRVKLLSSTRARNPQSSDNSFEKLRARLVLALDYCLAARHLSRKAKQKSAQLADREKKKSFFSGVSSGTPTRSVIRFHPNIAAIIRCVCSGGPMNRGSGRLMDYSAGAERDVSRFVPGVGWKVGRWKRRIRFVVVVGLIWEDI